MAEIKAVEDAGDDPKAGKQRPSSDTQFPYYDLKDATEVARTVRDKTGGVCDREQLAAYLGHKGVRSGAFLSRVSAAKMFGLIDQRSDGKFRLTKRGQTVLSPVTEQAAAKAKVDAFMSVELFKKVYDEFKGQSLPAEVGLKNLFSTTYGLVDSRVSPTVRIMYDSAQEAGLFAASGDRTRMVVPPLASGATDATEHRSPPVQEPPPHQHGGAGGGGRGGGGSIDNDEIDPAIRGLIEKLPPSGETLSEKRRKRLIDAFTAVVNYIYPEPDESGE